MKKTITLILVLVLILCSTALADSVKAVADPTYVRTGPGLDYKIVDSLPMTATGKKMHYALKQQAEKDLEAGELKRK